MKKYLAMLLAGALSVSMLAGCGGNSGSSTSSAGSAGSSSAGDASSSAGSTSSAASGSAFKLGGTGPLTGGASIYGLAAQRGAQIAVDEIAEAGGDIQFTLRYEDDQHDPEKAVNAYNTLKSWGMQISLGSVTSKPGEATSVLNNEDRIFALTPSASSPAVIEGKDNVYQMCFTDDNQGLASAQYISEQGPAEKVFIIWKNDDVYSTGIKNQ